MLSTAALPQVLRHTAVLRLVLGDMREPRPLVHPLRRSSPWNGCARAVRHGTHYACV